MSDANQDLSAWLLQCPMELTVQLCLIRLTQRQLTLKVTTTASPFSTAALKPYFPVFLFFTLLTLRCNEENLHAWDGCLQLFQTTEQEGCQVPGWAQWWVCSHSVEMKKGYFPIKSFDTFAQMFFSGVLSILYTMQESICGVCETEK